MSLSAYQYMVDWLVGWLGREVEVGRSKGVRGKRLRKGKRDWGRGSCEGRDGGE